MVSNHIRTTPDDASGFGSVAFICFPTMRVVPDNIRQPCPWSSLLIEADVYFPSVLYVSVTAAFIWQRVPAIL
ncbi:rCG41332 [Rattus norvegicus]|uniref:RCG41332 n=1 Tax=Rattus norvegicus TaxID=10116 RepID=A6IHA7_RAT|nr:rCG41332 [Rattus norvegicus]